MHDFSGTGCIAGVDEVGRGCLAGPVVACAVVFHAEPPSGLADSKVLKPQQRQSLEPQIKNCSHFGIGVVWQKQIDAINILQATFEAMSKAIVSLRVAPEHILVDGNKTIPSSTLMPIWQHYFSKKLPTQQAVIKGDATIASIAAASILAKTFRDRLMGHLAKQWPGYGFERHMGYGTKMHMQALQRLGPCPLHRLTFRGVRPEPQIVQTTLC